MKATVEKVENRRATVNVEVEPEVVAQAVERAYRTLARRVQIPGFRKGRAPRFLVERYVGKAALYEEALDELLPKAYTQAVAETGIEPIDRPRLTVDSFDEATGLRFTAEVEVKPEVDLGDYRSLRLDPPTVTVSDQEVEEQLRQLQELHATLVPVEDQAAEKGMVAVVDLAGSVEGEPIANGQATNYSLELGSGRWIGNAEEQMLGMRPGEERDIQVVFPDDHPEEKLRGKQATFRVHLKELKRKQLPELDDEFAREVAGVASLDDLRARLKAELTEVAQRRARAELRQRVVQEVVQRAQLEEVPETLVQRRIDQMVDDLASQLRRQGTDLDRFLEQSNQTRESLREQFRERAMKDVRTDLVLDAVARREGIEVLPEEVEAEGRVLAAASGQPYERLKPVLERSGWLLELAEQVRRRKVIDRLVELATGESQAAPTASSEGAAAPSGEGAVPAPQEDGGISVAEGSGGAEPSVNAQGGEAGVTVAQGPEAIPPAGAR